MTSTCMSLLAVEVRFLYRLFYCWHISVLYYSKLFIQCHYLYLFVNTMPKCRYFVHSFC